MYLDKKVYNSMRSSKKFSGSFIVLCGFDGSGKTTQTKEIARHYSTERHIIQTFNTVIGIEIIQKLEIT
ncbi:MULTISPECIES: hypothetical protein [unclassified Bartonella]|uniref:hypothetical protein n=1 Tax=unclassified Bartonella TaxID=2645622 RepID=UPI0035CF7EEE